PNLIRIQSDEVTYHFHVLLRFEIEKGLIEGNISVKDLEDIWNEKIKTYLGLDVPTAAQGVLQDIHWSHGSFGYFPTYSLGSFYAAQLFNAAKKALPNLMEEIEASQYGNLLEWLRNNIHRYGRIYNSEDLCKKATGETLNFSHFMGYITDKYRQVYEV
ncbi:MAG: carboxypeptidase M32, partial [Bacteroidota bacterium]|nr:carboxypeptidase M32 [Bacteroidota bacterium]